MVSGSATRRACTASAAVNTEVTIATRIFARHTAIRTASTVAGARVGGCVDDASALTTAVDVTFGAAIAVVTLARPGVAVL